LRRSEDFRLTLTKGRRVKGEGLELYAHPNQTPGCRRLGIVVRKRVGSAVVRNRTKRLVREFFRLHGDQLPEATDLVVSVGEDLSCLKLGELESRMVALTRQLRTHGHSPYRESQNASVAAAPDASGRGN
jgi:ribonuclease P protein component